MPADRNIFAVALAAPLLCLAGCEAPEAAHERSLAVLSACGGPGLTVERAATFALQRGFENIGPIALTALKDGRQTKDHGPVGELDFKSADGWWTNFSHDQYLAAYSYVLPADEALNESAHPAGALVHECLMGGEDLDRAAFVNDAIRLYGPVHAILAQDDSVSVMLATPAGYDFREVTVTEPALAVGAQNPTHARVFWIVLSDAEPRTRVGSDDRPTVTLTRAALIQALAAGRTAVFTHSWSNPEAAASIPPPKR